LFLTLVIETSLCSAFENLFQARSIALADCYRLFRLQVLYQIEKLLKERGVKKPEESSDWMTEL
jgi:hypothetical protein